MLRRDFLKIIGIAPIVASFNFQKHSVYNIVTDTSSAKVTDLCWDETAEHFYLSCQIAEVFDDFYDSVKTTKGLIVGNKIIPEFAWLDICHHKGLGTFEVYGLKELHPCHQ